MAHSWNRIDPNLIPSNIKDGISIFGVDGNFAWGTPPTIGSSQAWYQLTRILQNAWSNLEFFVLWQRDTASEVLRFAFRREDSSDNFTTVYPMILNKSNAVLTYWSTWNISNATSWGSPFGVQFNWIRSISFDWIDSYKVIWGSRFNLNNDWEYTYNRSTNARSNLQYTRNSNDKAPFGTIITNTSPFNIWSLTCDISTYTANSWSVNLLDPQLIIL